MTKNLREFNLDVLIFILSEVLKNEKRNQLKIMWYSNLKLQNLNSEIFLSHLVAITRLNIETVFLMYGIVASIIEF